MFTYITSKGEEGEVLHPIVVVDEFCAVGSIALEVEEMGQLGLDTADIVGQRLLVEQIALLALATGVTDHASGASDECYGLVATALEVAQHHDSAEMTDMKAVCSGIDADIRRYLFFLEEFLRARHHLMDHATP